MISKAKIKWAKSLQVKKYRQEEQCFIVQGTKGVQELLQSSFQVEWLAATEDILNGMSNQLLKKAKEVSTVSVKELEAMSSFQSNETVLAVARMKTMEVPRSTDKEYLLALDDIRDPGNLGTIIRTADWFGIHKIVASLQTADFYNPKTISATMGSFCRVEVAYTDLPKYLATCQVPIYGAFLQGRSVHLEKFGKSGVVVVGNESNGISEAVEKLIRNRIFIPGAGKAESLNAAIATGIILDNIFRSK
jgi:TrmH family RNA methyltransferase